MKDVREAGICIEHGRSGGADSAWAEEAIAGVVTRFSPGFLALTRSRASAPVLGATICRIFMVFFRL